MVTYNYSPFSKLPLFRFFSFSFYKISFLFFHSLSILTLTFSSFLPLLGQQIVPKEVIAVALSGLCLGTHKLLSSLSPPHSPPLFSSFFSSLLSPFSGVFGKKDGGEGRMVPSWALCTNLVELFFTSYSSLVSSPPPVVPRPPNSPTPFPSEQWPLILSLVFGAVHYQFSSSLSSHSLSESLPLSLSEKLSQHHYTLAQKADLLPWASPLVENLLFFRLFDVGDDLKDGVWDQCIKGTASNPLPEKEMFRRLSNRITYIMFFLSEKWDAPSILASLSLSSPSPSLLLGLTEKTKDFGSRIHKRFSRDDVLLSLFPRNLARSQSKEKREEEERKKEGNEKEEEDGGEGEGGGNDSQNQNSKVEGSKSNRKGKEGDNTMQKLPKRLEVAFLLAFSSCTRFVVRFFFTLDKSLVSSGALSLPSKAVTAESSQESGAYKEKEREKEDEENQEEERKELGFEAEFSFHVVETLSFLYLFRNTPHYEEVLSFQLSRISAKHTLLSSFFDLFLPNQFGHSDQSRTVREIVSFVHQQGQSSTTIPSQGSSSSSSPSPLPLTPLPLPSLLPTLNEDEWLEIFQDDLFQSRTAFFLLQTRSLSPSLPLPMLTDLGCRLLPLLSLSGLMSNFELHCLFEAIFRSGYQLLQENPKALSEDVTCYDPSSSSSSGQPLLDIFPPNLPGPLSLISPYLNLSLATLPSPTLPEGAAVPLTSLLSFHLPSITRSTLTSVRIHLQHTLLSGKNQKKKANSLLVFYFSSLNAVDDSLLTWTFREIESFFDWVSRKEISLNGGGGAKGEEEENMIENLELHGVSLRGCFEKLKGGISSYHDYTRHHYIYEWYIRLLSMYGFNQMRSGQRNAKNPEAKL